MALFFLRKAEMNTMNFGILEYMAIAEFKRNVIMNKYKILGDPYKEDAINKLDELDQMVQTGVAAFLKPLEEFQESDDQKE